MGTVTRTKLWEKHLIPEDSDSSGKLQMELWWNSLKPQNENPKNSFYDVFLYEIDFAKMIKISSSQKLDSPLLKGKKRIQTLYNYAKEHTHVVFYSLTGKYVVIYGNISCCNSLWTNLDVLKIRNTDLVTLQPPSCCARQEKCPVCELSNSDGAISPIHSGDFGNSRWVSTYRVTGACVRTDTNISWRLEMALSYSGGSTKIPLNILDGLATETGRSLDNVSYNVCKILAAYHPNLERSIINSERFFMKVKLLSFHSRERDIVLLCLANGIHLTVALLTNSEPFNGKSVMERFVRYFPSKALPQYGFFVPFEQLPHDLPNDVEMIKGYALISYMEMIHWYFPTRVERDIHAQVSKGYRTKLSTVWNSYQSRKKNTASIATESEIAALYGNSSVFGEFTTTVEQLEKQILGPIVDSLAILGERTKMHSYSSPDIVHIRLSPMQENKPSKVPIDVFLQSRKSLPSCRYGKSETVGGFEPDQLAQSIEVLMSRITEDEMETLFPPCIRSLYEISTKRHLYHAERTRLLLFHFSLGLDKETVATIWRQICNQNASSSVPTDYSLEVFLKQHKYGKIVESLWKSVERSSGRDCREGGTSQNFGTMQYRCKSTIQIVVPQTSNSICPFAKGVEDIEDLVSDCTTRCSRVLSESISPDNPNKLRRVRSPKEYFLNALHLKAAKLEHSCDNDAASAVQELQ